MLKSGLLLLLCAGIAASQPDPKKPDDKKPTEGKGSDKKPPDQKTEPKKSPEKKPEPEKLITQIHDLKPIFSSLSKPADVPDADAVVHLIVESLRLSDLKSSGEGPRIVIREGNRLEIRANATIHRQVDDLIMAAAHLGDIAVDVKGELLELTPEVFEKNVKGLFKPLKGKSEPLPVATFGSAMEAQEGAEKPLTLAEVDAIAKLGTVVQSSKIRASNGVETAVSARQLVFSHKPLPNAPPSLDKEGYRLIGLFVVTPDRRFVRARLMEQSAEVIGTKKRHFGAFTATAPDIAEFGRLATVEVQDGGAILFKLNYAPKGKIWLVLLRPTVFIQAEADMRKKSGLKKPEEKKPVEKKPEEKKPEEKKPEGK